MVTIKQIIRLYQAGKSQRSMERQLNICRPTIKKYLQAFQESGCSTEELLALSESDLEDLFGRARKSITYKSVTNITELEKLFPGIEKELKRVGVSRKLLWQEYKDQYPDGLGYSQFCYHFQQWQDRQQVSMHIEHKAGDKVFVDFSGKKLPVVDKVTGEEKLMEVFVAILPASQLTYVEAVESQKKEDFIKVVENALWYFGGVPAAVLSDNLKSAIEQASHYEPVVNATFQEFALYYCTAILATRAAKPKDKALVEGAVKLVYTRIFAPLRNQQFFSLQELNRAIHDKLQEHNTTNFTGRDYSRLMLFNQIEKSLLAALPQEKYELKMFKQATVYKSSHIWLGEDKHYYSVPYRYLKEKVKVVYSSSSVEIFHKHIRIAIHQRDKRPYLYTTQREHMPSAHNFVAEWNPEKFIKWGLAIGPATGEYIKKVLQYKLHPEQGYKACIGILKYADKATVGKDRLENACKRALFYESYSYRIISNILEKGLDKIDMDHEIHINLPPHENIRGKGYYK